MSQLFPPKATWSVNDIPSLAGKHTLVTGGNTGIGKQTCKQLLLHGAARVYLAARSEGKAKEAIADLERETEGKRKGDIVFVKLDLADLESCNKAALEVREKLKENGHNGRLDILFANAGIMTPPKDQITTQSYDMQFGTNVLGHFLFIHQLIPALQIPSPSSQTTPSRIVWTASSAHLFHTPPIKYDTLKDGPKRRKKSAWGLYTQSKYAAVLVARSLANRYYKKGEPGSIVTVVIDPGNIQSDLQRNTNSVLKAIWVSSGSFSIYVRTWKLT
jgi:NAD(P)-dependent dehydrogenase (short-subunit alcohol dehydrogenase family)